MPRSVSPSTLRRASRRAVLAVRGAGARSAAESDPARAPPGADIVTMAACAVKFKAYTAMVTVMRVVLKLRRFGTVMQTIAGGRKVVHWSKTIGRKRVIPEHHFRMRWQDLPAWKSL